MKQLSIEAIIPTGIKGITRSQRSDLECLASKRIKSAIAAHLSGHISKASKLYDEEILDNSTNPIVYSNRAAIYYAHNQYQAALQLLEQAHFLQQTPSHASYLVAYCALLTNDYNKAWQYYEYRWLNNFIPDINLALPAVDPQCIQSRSKSKYLLHQDGGLGDLVFVLHLFSNSTILQETKYLGDAKSCSIIRALTRDITVISDQSAGKDVETGDFLGWIPLQSLMRLNPSPLMRRPQLQSARKLDLKTLPLKVGIHWQGNSLNELNLLPGSRSVPFSLFIDLLVDESFEVYSLQLGRHAQQSNIFSSLLQYAAHLDPLASTSNARYIETVKSMDLIVCVDSFVANLAGYLQIPTVLIVSQHHDWRWTVRDSKGFSTFYPTVKIMEWTTAITSEQVHEYVHSFIAQK